MCTSGHLLRAVQQCAVAGPYSIAPELQPGPASTPSHASPLMLLTKAVNTPVLGGEGAAAMAARLCSTPHVRAVSRAFVPPLCLAITLKPYPTISRGR